MSISPRLRKRRNRLWAEHPYCYWCGVRLDLSTGPGDKNIYQATLDHLHPIGHPERGKHNGEETTVLACTLCNSYHNTLCQLKGITPPPDYKRWRGPVAVHILSRFLKVF